MVIVTRWRSGGQRVKLATEGLPAALVLALALQSARIPAPDAERRRHWHLGQLEGQREDGAEDPGASVGERRQTLACRRFGSIGDGPGCLQVEVIEVYIEESRVVDSTQWPL